MKKLRFAVRFVLAGVLALAQAPGAVKNWSAAVALSTGGEGWEASAAVDASGAAVAVWDERTITNTIADHIWSRTRSAAGSWSATSVISPATHPDLQRKLYRLVKTRFTQAIIATHSVEIMAEADPSDILIVNNKQKRSAYANTEPGVQVLIDQLGGIHNVHLARLWNARRVIRVEGDDVGFLKTLHATLYGGDAPRRHPESAYGRVGTRDWLQHGIQKRCR